MQQANQLHTTKAWCMHVPISRRGLAIMHNSYTGRQKAVTQTHFYYGETSYCTVVGKHY